MSEPTPSQSAAGGSVPPSLPPSAATALPTQPVDGSERTVREASPEHPPIAGYEILGELGRGGMGIVYRARQLACDRVVALKLLLTGPWASAEEQQRFQRETKLAANLDHPHIVPIYEVGDCRGHRFYSMKLIEGGSLSQHRQCLRDDLWEAARLLARVARAVHHAHCHGVLHRDLKPANILLDAQGQPYVTDFGLAKGVGDEASLTKPGTIVGTPNYMAPEQTFGKKSIGPAADVWALGAILYECLTGRLPFQRENALDTLLDVRQKQPALPREVNPRIDRTLEAICMKCLEKDPGTRYATAEALAEDLERRLAGEVIGVRPVRWTQRLQRWWGRYPLAAGLVAFLVVALLAVGGTTLWQRWRMPADEPAPSNDGTQPNDEPRPAPQGPLGSVRQTTALDQRGNGKTTLQLWLPPTEYLKLRTRVFNIEATQLALNQARQAALAGRKDKPQNDNRPVLFRRVGLLPDWSDVRDTKESFDDATNLVTLSCTQRGVARTRLGDWEVRNPAGLALVSIKDNVATFQGTSLTGLGLMRSTVIIQAPRGVMAPGLSKLGNRVIYRLPLAPKVEGDRPAASFIWQAQPVVMSCLAKCYVNRKVSRLWVARAVLHNTGNQTLKEYRVRFRVPVYTTGWSPWQLCDEVAPGQTVVDAYFPVFDLKAVATVQGARDARLEVEYDYRKGDGMVVHQTDVKPIKVLGLNDVVFSSMKPEEVEDFQDRYDYAPLFLASFVTPRDRVIQEVAGLVTGQVRGGEFSLLDKEARKFMRGLYEFLAGNKIKYQTGAERKVDGRPGQHVKYGREVLRDHAGTSLDLAICYASVCKAVGLRVKMILVSGHCFPAVVLPESGGLLAVETSGIGTKDFDEAIKIGFQEVREARKGHYYEVDVQGHHDAGVSSADLPPLPEDVLQTWGIRRIDGGRKVP